MMHWYLRQDGINPARYIGPFESSQDARHFRRAYDLSNWQVVKTDEAVYVVSPRAFVAA